MRVSIHNVNKVHVATVQLNVESGDYICQTITVYDDNGVKHEIDLFADTDVKLLPNQEAS